MKTNKNLVLIGMMGSGKSTLGRLIAKKLGLVFIDVDHKIELIEKVSVSKIFKKHGERYFRMIEEKISSQILMESSKSVISLGGGAFLNKKIQDLVLKKNISFWLKWKNTSIIKRLKNFNKRPVLKDMNNEQITNLINQRSKTYSKADYIIECDSLIKSEIIEKIIQIYETN
tara:strand:- start:1343 stop:1858 length:516 start_codon:yes stop_codon:yes gene_type:complete